MGYVGDDSPGFGLFEHRQAGLKSQFTFEIRRRADRSMGEKSSLRVNEREYW